MAKSKSIQFARRTFYGGRTFEIGAVVTSDDAKAMKWTDDDLESLTAGDAPAANFITAAEAEGIADVKAVQHGVESVDSRDQLVVNVGGDDIHFPDSRVKGPNEPVTDEPTVTRLPSTSMPTATPLGVQAAARGVGSKAKTVKAKNVGADVHPEDPLTPPPGPSTEDEPPATK